VTAREDALPESVAAGEFAHEDLDRARDHAALDRARLRPGRLRALRVLWLITGPGVLVFLGENDAPSMISYAATGARYGVGFFLPFVLATFAVGFVVQEMAARVGAASGRGHAELIFARFGAFWGWFAMADLAVGNLLTLVTEFIGVRAGLGFFGVPPAVAVVGCVLVVALTASTSRYRVWERAALGLALLNAVFVPVALLAAPDWGAVGHAFLTWGPLRGGLTPDAVTLMVANIGATVTPWMLFFQQGAVVDKGLRPGDVGGARLDTLLGAVFAAVFGVAGIIATTPLFAHGISAGDFQGAQFAQALQPYVGRVGAGLFALGIASAGLVAAVTISTSSAYAAGEVVRGGAHSLNAPLREGRLFYAVLLGSSALAGAAVLVPGVPLESVVIIVNVVATLAMPPALVFLLLLANDAEVMGPHRNGGAWNVAGIGVTVLLVLTGLAYGVTVLFPALLGG
jgi:Mn2+/Fe2+ NRAMP family transporter